MKASIVIPSFNAFERLNYNLLSLSLQNCSKDIFEVIVVDNCSTDKTGELIFKYQKLMNIKGIYMSQNQTRSHARNAGIEAASGDIIIFSDSDMISERDYVTKHIEAHRGNKDVICGMNWEKIYTFYYKDFTGYLLKNLLKMKHLYNLSDSLCKIPNKCCIVDEEKIVSGAYKKLTFTNAFYDYGYQEILKKYGTDLLDFKFSWSFFVTNNCSVRKENVVNAGMFDEAFKGWGCEDLDLGYRLYKNGCNFRKENIESIHQEHPVNFAENGLKNIHLFSEKYDSVDVLLFYFHHLIPTDIHTANELAKEIELIEQKEEFKFILVLFRDLLRAARDSAYKGQISSTDYILEVLRIKRSVENNKSLLNSIYTKLKEQGKCDRFISAIKTLEKKVLKSKYQD